MVNTLAWAREHLGATTSLIEEMVLRETPSDNEEALASFARWFSAIAIEWFGAKVKTVRGGHLLCEFELAGRRRGGGQLLLLGHYDTVWPMGTIRKMPCEQREGRLWGPGTLDMKGGIAIALMAIQALRELDTPVAARVLLQLNADEETGSHTSRALTEKNARASRAVLVMEPGTGLAGKLKTARKGVGDYRLKVTGRASHAGVDFENGASAILELSRQLLKVAAFTNLAKGITVNPGVVSGGTRSNVVAAEAEAHVDIRVAKLRDAIPLERKFRALTPDDRRCSVQVEGGLNRPPMERTKEIAKLFQSAAKIGREMGVNVEESATGGGSDGNFTAALGIPTLDGLGAVGEGAHAPHESLLIDRIPDRVALLAGLIKSHSDPSS